MDELIKKGCRCVVFEIGKGGLPTLDPPRLAATNKGEFQSGLLDLIGQIPPKASPDKPLVIFVDEVNVLLSGEPVYPLVFGYLKDGNLSKSIWLFAGTLGDTDEVAKQSLQLMSAESKGPDFLSRQDGFVSAPGLDVPFERIAKSLGAIPQDKRPHRIENFLLFSLAVTPFSDVREIRRKILDGVARMQQRDILALNDVWQPQEAARFLQDYEKLLQNLRPRSVEVRWEASRGMPV